MTFFLKHPDPRIQNTLIAPEFIDDKPAYPVSFPLLQQEERAEQLRPNCRIETETRLQWLREADALLRTKLFDRSAAGAFDAVGADRPWEQPVQDDQPLLAPPPFDALYPHLLCAQMDAALGETDRYAGEQAQYNALYAELAVWLRQNYPPRSRVQWRW